MFARPQVASTGALGDPLGDASTRGGPGSRNHIRSGGSENGRSGIGILNAACAIGRRPGQPPIVKGDTKERSAAMALFGVRLPVRGFSGRG